MNKKFEIDGSRRFDTYEWNKFDFGIKELKTIELILSPVKTIKMEKQKITSYADLDVYKRSYSACLLVMKEIVPRLPDIEKYDLRDQLSRSSKSIPRLIAEGFAKKYQKAGYQKYLFDAIGESNETEVSLAQSRDIYPQYIKTEIANNLINEYKIIGKQLFRLQETWSRFSNPKAFK